MSGYVVQGRGDLDAVFAYWSSGGQYGATGYIMSGYGDIGYRYQLIGAATPIAATGFKVGSTDFANIFRGASAGVPSHTSLSAAQVQVDRWDGGTPAELYIHSDGNVYVRTGTATSNRGAWIDNPALVGDYEVRVTATSGSFSSGSNGVWENLSSTRIWTRGAGAATYHQVNFTIEIRRVSDGVIETSRSDGIMSCDRS